jgi:hypothetical protein
MNKWAWEQWSDPKSHLTKDDKNTPQQKHSHMNMVWEALLKHPLFRPKSGYVHREQDVAAQYFKTGRG